MSVSSKESIRTIASTHAMALAQWLASIITKRGSLYYKRRNGRIGLGTFTSMIMKKSSSCTTITWATTYCGKWTSGHTNAHHVDFCGRLCNTVQRVFTLILYSNISTKREILKTIMNYFFSITKFYRGAAIGFLVVVAKSHFCLCCFCT